LKSSEGLPYDKVYQVRSFTPTENKHYLILMIRDMLKELFPEAKELTENI
jgi:hypothetical protein